MGSGRCAAAAVADADPDADPDAGVDADPDDFWWLWWTLAGFERFFCKSCYFPWYIRQFYEKVVILLRIFENYAFEALEFNTPIKDPKLDGRFVERIRGATAATLFGVHSEQMF